MTNHVRTICIFINNVYLLQCIFINKIDPYSESFKTRPPLFKCKIIIKVGQQLGAKHQIRFAFIWGITFSDLLSFGAQHYLICLHLGRAFLPKAFLIGSADFFNEMWTDTKKIMCNFFPKSWTTVNIKKIIINKKSSPEL